MRPLVKMSCCTVVMLMNSRTIHFMIKMIYIYRVSIMRLTIKPNQCSYVDYSIRVS